ncbi:hypothetical protein [Chlorogloea sp. CCALA 695]|uniref:hypothetical protein n=1 Tax=Chlorogloea sp. CCALA 695 TaxID=2107693 RepID=UPI000D085C1A|nr:hypothetical protein [Chlorogloea sp. CCALA 695]PSB27686.1 hypothetical protein C7B70_21840 [Chlorogloea sp. CCALA 695]
MISVTENIKKLTWQENQLHSSLDNLRGQRSKVKEHKQLAQELSRVVSKRQNLQDWAIFELGMPVHRLNSPLLGIVEQLKITPGGMGEVWVSWDGLLQIPEQPNMLQLDSAAMAKIIAVGDRIEIVDGHKEAGKIFTVERLLARGAVETTDEIVFEREEWQKIEEADQESLETAKEGNEELKHSASFTQSTQMVTKSKEELNEKAPETIVTVDTTVISTQIEELTEDEEKERHRLELKVERAFYEAGTALRELRDKRLYRSTHRSWEGYCKERFGYGRDCADLKISASIVVEEIKKLPTNRRQFLPTTLEQVRPLIKLQKLEDRTFAWQQAVEQADGKVPSGRIVKDIVQRLKEKPLVKASDFCTIGDPFILTRLEGAERKYNGCWAIAFEVRDFTIAVDVYDNTLTVKPDNLDPIDLPDVRRQLPQTLKRIKKLRNIEILDRGAKNILKDLGRQIYLTDLENKLLSFLEREYRIEE